MMVVELNPEESDETESDWVMSVTKIVKTERITPYSNTSRSSLLKYPYVVYV